MRKLFLGLLLVVMLMLPMSVNADRRSKAYLIGSGSGVAYGVVTTDTIVILTEEYKEAYLLTALTVTGTYTDDKLNVTVDGYILDADVAAQKIASVISVDHTTLATKTLIDTFNYVGILAEFVIVVSIDTVGALDADTLDYDLYWIPVGREEGL